MHEHTPPSPNRSRFSSIDQVSDEIFDKFDDIAPTVRPARAEVEQPSPKPVVPADHQPPRLSADKSEELPTAWVSAVEAAAQELLGTMLQKASEQQPRDANQDLRRALIAAHVKDIGPDATRRQSKLPEGIDLLKGVPSPSSDEALMASIRRMMTDQKRDFSLRALPVLEPAQTDTPPPATETADRTDAARDGGVYDSAKAKILQAFRKDFALAANTAFWGFLALFLFLDPRLSLVLFGNAIFVLIAICFVFMPERLTDAALDIWRRTKSIRASIRQQEISE
jgi:hypothetical protein